MTAFESRHRRFLAEINVIPLVDVVLVLLVIFMVTAPMLYRGMDINLPKSATNTIKP
ncbi:MAG TPA: biopolymer transporter ExbD, partial [Nitrospiraceae bacterium]